MKFGNGSTKRDRPSRAFAAYKEKFSIKKIDFGNSSIPSNSIYRKKWADGANWFWKILKLTLLIVIGLFIMWIVVSEIINSWS